MGTFRLAQTDGIATLVVSGETGPEEAIEVLRALAQDPAAGAPLLIDIREARSPGLTFEGAYEVAAVLGSLADAYPGRIAVLDGFDELYEKTQFFEASATARGVQVRAFVSEAAALRWLREEAPGG